MFEQKHELPQRMPFERRSSFSCAFPLVTLDTFSRRSLSYNKLPQKPLKLSVLKLDSTSFEIEVAKTATVAELRNSVERAFSHLPKDGPGTVSWSHVWGHFCLCFDGQMLLDDNDYIADYEIRDGDQLLFARHLSINYNLKRTGSAEQVGDIEQPRISNSWEPVYEIDDGINENCDDQTHQQACEEENNIVVTHSEYKLATILRGWFSYRRVSSSPQPKFEPKSFSKSSSGVLDPTVSNQKAAMGGGLDPLLLNGMYDQGMVRQHVSSTQHGGGSSSSMDLPGMGKSATLVLALPAPDGTVQKVGQDPFAASLSIPPPSYVQMDEIEKKQQMLVQEQMVWQQYAREGMQGQTSLGKINAGGYYPPGYSPAMPYGMPSVNGMGYTPPGQYYYQYRGFGH